MMRDGLRTLLCTLAVVVGAELVSRYLTSSADGVWEYWSEDAFFSFSEFHKLESKGMRQEVVVCGDSTGYHDIDINELANLTGRVGKTWNLSSPGNFPLAFRVSTLPLLRRTAESDPQERTIVISFIPAGLVPDFETPSEKSIISAAACADRDPIVEIRRMFSLLRLRLCLKYLIAPIGSPTEILNHRGGEVLIGKKREIKTVRSDGEPVSSLLNPARTGVLRDLLSLLNQAKWHAVIVIPPSNETELRRLNTVAYRSFLSDLRKDFDFTLLDFFESGIFKDDDFFDANHLNESGATKLTRELAKALQAN
jgi:hypothetical protein